MGKLVQDDKGWVRRRRLLVWAPAVLAVVVLGYQAPPSLLSSPKAALPALAAETPVEPPTARPETRTGVTPAQLVPYDPVVTVVATGLEIPWALAFAPDGRLFFTERPGRLRVMAGARLQATPVATLPVAAVGEGGLMGLALDPQFAQNHFLYVMYTYTDSQGNLRNKISRLTEANGVASNETTVIDNIPGAVFHDGGRIKFGPDGKLYVTTGDALSGGLAQDVNSLAGKVLRINADGSVPPDNPFPGSPVYTFGHRNSQGLAWDSRTGLLFATEHGPTGNDEVNLIQAGRNYGWPTVSGQAADPRFAEPILAFTPSVAPSGALFYNGQQLWKWTGDLFFATLVGNHLHHVVLQGPDFRQVATHEALFSGVYGRLRDVVQGPDGFIYFATNNRDGRGSTIPEDDRILRIVPSIQGTSKEYLPLLNVGAP